MMKKLHFVFTAFLLPSLLASAHAAPCADAEELEALRVRALQTELMVAALSCDSGPQYNQFIHDYSRDLKTHASGLRGYFERIYGPDGEMQMNRYITKLANDVSTRSGGNGKLNFCTEATTLSKEVLARQKLRLVNFRYLSSIPLCADLFKPKGGI